MTLSFEELTVIKTILNQYTSSRQRSFDSEVAESALVKLSKLTSDFENECTSIIGSSTADFKNFPFTMSYDHKEILKIFENVKQTEFDF